MSLRVNGIRPSTDGVPREWAAAAARKARSTAEPADGGAERPFIGMSGRHKRRLGVGARLVTALQPRLQAVYWILLTSQSSNAPTRV